MVSYNIYISLSLSKRLTYLVLFFSFFLLLFLHVVHSRLKQKRYRQEKVLVSMPWPTSCLELLSIFKAPSHVTFAMWEPLWHGSFP